MSNSGLQDIGSDRLGYKRGEGGEGIVKARYTSIPTFPAWLDRMEQKRKK